MDVVEKLSDESSSSIKVNWLPMAVYIQQLVSQSHSNSLEQIFTQLTGQVEQSVYRYNLYDVLKSWPITF